jgi:hypothetical protein
MTKTITLTLRVEDAEPILAEAAYEAAKFGSLLDYVPRKCWNSPRRSGVRVTHEQQNEDWRARFLRAKRIVESFGLEYEQPSEAETIDMLYDECDEKKLVPRYRGEVHREAAKAAAGRVVRRWKERLATALAA